MNCHYHINLFWSDDDQAWIADVPDLKCCSAHGDTPVEALAQVEQAMDAWIEVAQEAGITVPPPRYRPAIYASKAVAG
jgi:predicted RNase H-like HicB family nuclease